MTEIEPTLTPRQFVLSRHPKAFCETNGPGLYQVIFLGKYAVATVLGMGSNRRRAWRSAAQTLSKAGQ